MDSYFTEVNSLRGSVKVTVFRNVNTLGKIYFTRAISEIILNKVTVLFLTRFRERKTTLYFTKVNSLTMISRVWVSCFIKMVL